MTLYISLINNINSKGFIFISFNAISISILVSEFFGLFNKSNCFCFCFRRKIFSIYISIDSTGHISQNIFLFFFVLRLLWIILLLSNFISDKFKFIDIEFIEKSNSFEIISLIEKLIIDDNLFNVYFNSINLI